MLHQMKAPQFYSDSGLQNTVLNPLANSKIQRLFKAFECFSSTFQGKFYFQGLFKTVLYIQILFKPVRTLIKAFFGFDSWFKQYFICNLTSILQYKNIMVQDLTVSNRLYGPRRDKTCLQGYRQNETQASLLSYKD